MIGRNDVEELSGLARLSIPEADKDKLSHDLQSILNYISELSAAPLGTPERQDLGLVKNQMREDDMPNERRGFTEVLLAVAPRIKNGYIEVKKILNPNNG